MVPEPGLGGPYFGQVDPRTSALKMETAENIVLWKCLWVLWAFGIFFKSEYFM